MYGYIYETTNLINGMKYIGQHKSEKFDKSYLGSGVKLNKAINKYGRENFTVELITWKNTKEELDWEEKMCIYFWRQSYKNEMYNDADGGDGGNTCRYKTQVELDDINKKRRNTLKGQIYINKDNKVKRVSLSDFESIYKPLGWDRGFTKEIIEKQVKSRDYGSIAKKLKQLCVPEDRKSKISKSVKKLWNDQEYAKRQSDAHKGHLLTNETREKISKANKGRKHSDETKTKIGKTKIGNNYCLGYRHTEEAKEKISKSKKGKNLSKAWRDNLSNARKGKILMNNGNIAKFVNIQEEQKYLKCGWKRGRK